MQCENLVIENFLKRCALGRRDLDAELPRKAVTKPGIKQWLWLNGLNNPGRLAGELGISGYSAERIIDYFYGG